MKPRSLPAAAVLTVLVLLPSLKAAAVSDLNSTEKRRAVITVAQQLTRPPEPAPLPADLAQPFSPPGFDQPDPEELRAAAAAATKAAGQSAVASGAGAAGSESGPPPGGDREILDGLAARLVPSGTIMLNGAPLLIIGKNRFEIGAHFIVSDNTHNQDYELELVSIDRTTFTLRYHSAEVTRPIKPGKSQ